MRKKNYFFSTMQYLTILVCKYFLWPSMFDLKVHGLDNLRDIKNEGVVFTLNHPSVLDGTLVSTIIPWKLDVSHGAIRFLTHYKYMYKKWYSFYLWMIGCYPVFPNGGDLEKSLRYTSKLLDKKYSVLFFPTGKIDKNFDPGKARRGAGYLAKTVDPVFVPVRLDFQKDTGKKKKASVVFGSPFKYSKELEWKEKEVQEVSILIAEKIAELKPIF